MTTINSLEILLKPYKGLDKIRVGSTFDGGYILPKASITKCKRVLSFGISTNIDFERQMAELNSNMVIHMYDPFIGPLSDLKRLMKRVTGNHTPVKRDIKLKVNDQYKNQGKGIVLETISRFFHWGGFYRFIAQKNIDYKKIGLSNSDDKLFTSFPTIFKKIGDEKDIIVKMDIEGYEYKVYKDLLQFSSRISVLLLELHEVDYNKQMIVDMIQSLKDKGLFLIHIHGNNSDVLVNNSSIPNTLELSFACKEYIEQQYDTTTYPDAVLDAPCNPYWEDYQLDFLKKQIIDTN